MESTNFISPEARHFFIASQVIGSRLFITMKFDTDKLEAGQLRLAKGTSKFMLLRTAFLISLLAYLLMELVLFIVGI